MNLHISEDYNAVCEQVTSQIIEQVRKKPDSLLCLAAGNTPLGVFARMAKAAQAGELKLDRVRFVSLDEWVGLDGTDQGSCRQTLDEHLFGPAGIPEENIWFFDGKSSDLSKLCTDTDAYIRDAGGIDLMLLGIGMNGHLGFNEPGASLDNYTFVTELDPVTKQVSVKYFDKPQAVQAGITLGMKHIMETQEVILMANGGHKADMIRAAFKEGVKENIPASVLQRHPHFHLSLDRAAAEHLV